MPLSERTIEIRKPQEKSETLFQESSQANIGRLAKGAGISLVGRVMGRGGILLNQVVLARLLGVDAFGLYALGWTILRISSLVVPLGLDKGVIRYGARAWHVDEPMFKNVIRQSLGGVTLFSLIIGFGFYLSASWLANHLFDKADLVVVFRGFSVVLVLAAILRVASEATRITQKMQFSVFAEELAPPVIQFVLIVLLIYLAGTGLNGAILSVELSFATGLALALFFIWRLFPEIFKWNGKSDFVAWKLLKFSLPTSLAGMFTMLIIWIDRLFVGYFLEASDVGIYQAASQMTLLLSIVLSAFNVTFSPMIVKLYHSDRKKELNNLFKISTKWGLYLSIPLFLILSFASTEVLVVTFGAKYGSGALPMFILAVSQLINAGTGAVGLLLTMTGHQNRWLVISAFALLANVILNILLIPRFNLLGAALSTAGSITGLFVVALFQVKSVLGLWPYDKRYLKGFFAALLSIVALFMLRIFQPGLPIVHLLLVFLLSYGVFGGVLILMGLDNEDRQFIRLILQKMNLQTGKATV